MIDSKSPSAIIKLNELNEIQLHLDLLKGSAYQEVLTYVASAKSGTR